MKSLIVFLFLELILSVPTMALAPKRGKACYKNAEKIIEKFLEQAEDRAKKASVLRTQKGDFVESYKSKVFTGRQTNKEFRELAEKHDVPDGSPDHIYFDGENAVIKELNDLVLENKDEVTALTNYHKELFLNNLNSSEFKNLKKALESRNSNFKSLGFILKKGDEDLVADLDRLCKKTGSQFAEVVRSSSLLAGNKNLRGLASNPRSWFLCGTGANRGMANAAVRSARVGENAGEVAARKFDDIEQELNQVTKDIEDLRLTAVNGLEKKHPNLFESLPSDPDKKILSRELLDVFKTTKAEGRSREAYLKAVQDRLKVVNKDYPPPSVAELDRLHNYRELADRFSPGIHIDERVVIDLNRAKGEISSIDFKGQNIKNMQQTMLALARAKPGSSREAIYHARRGEQAATEALNDRMSKVRKLYQKVYGSDKRSQLSFSGDDGIAMPRKITEDHKVQIVRGLADIDPGGFRTTFIPKGVAPELRSKLIVEAENIEKKVRKELENLLPLNQRNELMVAIDMKGYSPGTGEVRAMLSGKAAPEAKEAVLKALRKVVEGQSGRRVSVDSF